LAEFSEFRRSEVALGSFNSNKIDPIDPRVGLPRDPSVIPKSSRIPLESFQSLRGFDSPFDSSENSYILEIPRIENSGVGEVPGSRNAVAKAGKLARLYRKFRKMVGSNGTMIAIRLVRSKLRKREDHHSSAVHPEATVVQTATSPATIGASPTHPNNCCTQLSTTSMPTDYVNNVCDEHIYATTPSANPVEPFAWQFPPPYPPPHMPPAQYALYNDQVGASCVVFFCILVYPMIRCCLR
jgi:CRISPR/Cas system CMR-associated protein Cmr5 small subunit